MLMSNSGATAMGSFRSKERSAILGLTKACIRASLTFTDELP